jgi:hypothetical protein
MKNELIADDSILIKNLIYTFRGVQVLIDRDLAALFQVTTSVLNQAVKRNLERFPESFRFQLSALEFEDWKSQIVMSNPDKMGLRRPPFAFTEQRVAMLSAVLRSEVAIKVSIKIMLAFVEMRKFISTNTGLFQRLDKVELKLHENDEKFEKVFKALERVETNPKQGVFYEGQIFDAYNFVSDLIRKANKSILLIDNYIDDSVLTILSKKKTNVDCYLFTKNITNKLKLDVEKFNKQYPTLNLVQFDKSHDRFLILDFSEVYHLGASLKDLGNKWFAFSKLDIASINIIDKLKELI